MSGPAELTLSWQWQESPQQPVHELDATWAELRIAVGAEAITLVHLPSTGVYRTHITVPLYPLAEWIAFNWWSLTSDCRPGTQISQLRGSYRNGIGDARGPWWTRSRRHTLRNVGDGFHWPDVLFYSEGAQTRIVWMPDTADYPRQEARFVGRGNTTVPSQALESTLVDFVDAVVTRLEKQGITDTPLAEEWSAVRAASEEEAMFCRRAAQLGLDPYGDAERFAADIVAAERVLPPHLADDFFNSVEPRHLTDRLSWLESAVATAGSGAAAEVAASTAELTAVCADITERFYRSHGLDDPWLLGFLTAQRVRSHLGVADTAEFNPEEFLTYHTSEAPYFDRGPVAYGTRTGTEGPTLVATRRFTRRPRRFLQARALWHVICDRNDTFMVVASHTHRQHIARGFALEVLAPARGIAALLSDPRHLVSSEDVDNIAGLYGVGTIVVEHQLDNKVLALDFDGPPRRRPDATPA